ncbi:hypothetical protein FH972_024415 [Carpinus fangiana]|uniref:Transglycosylase SLT domain-containing protein n=1 Tax=Carpinus fangiana TaxID=176857 RepID=A0A5N6KXZ5_9ROSI|nr:hypothetical protein FH972_024415 [Carpinus fangiana]
MHSTFTTATALAVIARIAAAQTAPGAVGATPDVEQGSGPNGSEEWLNTGVDGDGWAPPFLSQDDVVTISLDDFYANAGTACQQYDGNFQSAASSVGVRAEFLAFIAMQESSCDAGEGGPTPGLLQVACENYPDGSCDNKSVQDNVNAGAQVLKNGLDNAGGNIIQALGEYNGWFTGLTQGYPCSSEGQSNGSPQNLDYLQQVLNGWFQGELVYDHVQDFGTYQCSGSCDNGSLC